MEQAEKAEAYSFFRRAGSTGANLSFWVPWRVTSEGFLARLPIALGVSSSIERLSVNRGRDG